MIGVRASANLEDIERALRQMTLGDVLVGARRISSGDLSALFPSEEAAVARAISQRRNEFATGRKLLRQLIGINVAIPVAPNRAPILPAGHCASLAHDRNYAVAAASCSRQVLALGIDIEPDTPLHPSMGESVLRDDERGLDAHLAFTLKESAYKAWSCLGGRMLEHHDVRLSVSASTFTAVVLPEHAMFTGEFVAVIDRWVALVIVTANEWRGGRSVLSGPGTAM